MEQMGFPTYFLVVLGLHPLCPPSKASRWGPGVGSAAGSPWWLYRLGDQRRWIRLEHGLLFERFLTRSASR